MSRYGVIRHDCESFESAYIGTMVHLIRHAESYVVASYNFLTAMRESMARNGRFRRFPEQYAVSPGNNFRLRPGTHA